MRSSDWSSDGCSSDLGRKPVTPQRSDGLRIEPRLSVPIAKLQSAAATADAAPALDPPDGSAVFQGLRTMPPYQVAPWASSAVRTEESRVGKGCVSTCRSRWSPTLSKKKQKTKH